MTRKQAELYCEINKLRIRMQPHKTADGRKCWMLDLIPLWKHTGAPVSVTAATMGEALIDAVQRHRDIRRGKA